MFLVNNEEMRLLDQATIHEWGIPSLILMENAGIAIFQQLQKDIIPLEDKRILIICGCGNNGGDGLVLARQLWQHGHQSVVVAMLYEGEKNLSEEAAVNFQIIENLGIKYIDIDNLQKLNILKAQLSFSDVAIDCLFGTGLTRGLSNMMMEAIQIINAKKITRIAIDIPSGLNGSSGEILGDCVQADFTYTLGFPKQGQFLKESANKVGMLRVLSIGIPEETAERAGIQGRLLEETWLRKMWLKREPHSHKNKFGHIGIVAGRIGMGGACVLASKAAFRAGAGVVTALVDKGIFTTVATAIPEVMAQPIEWPNPAAISSLLEKTNVQIIGPGMGTSEEKQNVLFELLKRATGTVIIDADALNILAEGDGEPLRKTQAQCILTPHPGEMARLLGKSILEIQENRLSLTRKMARQFKCTVVLKGHHTIIASPTGAFSINPHDSVALATAGSGDVLTGIIAAFAANGLEAYDAACAGVLLHGLSGEYLASQKGVVSSMATDIIDSLSDIVRKFE